MSAALRSLLASAALLLLAGPGRYSFDAVIRRRLDGARRAQQSSPGAAPAS